MKVAVLGGGKSPEREVSLRSASAVAKALRQAGYEVIELDPSNGPDVLNSLTNDTIVFPILHGAGGEDGSIQQELESRGLQYLGSGAEASRLCFDKNLARQKLLEAGVPMAIGDSVTSETYPNNPLTKAPHVLKVQRGGSSIGTYIVRDPSNIDEQKVAEVFSLDENAIIEELVVGPEITVPILNTKALPVIEIVPPEAEEFNYDNKYNGKSQEICPAVSIDKSKQEEAQHLAEKVHKVLGCRHLSRIDIMCRKNGEMVVLEANTMPGMTVQSLYPLSAKTAGISMPELVNIFVDLVTK